MTGGPTPFTIPAPAARPARIPAYRLTATEAARLEQTLAELVSSVRLIASRAVRERGLKDGPLHSRCAIANFFAARGISHFDSDALCPIALATLKYVLASAGMTVTHPSTQHGRGREVYVLELGSDADPGTPLEAA